MRAAIFNRMPLPTSAYPIRVGGSAKIPARSAYELRLLGLPSGVYWLDRGGADPYRAYCDLLTLGGGWEKIDGFNSNTIFNGASITKGSYSIADATSAIRYAGPVSTAGGSAGDNVPVPFALEYLVKINNIQTGGGAGPASYFSFKVGGPITTYNDVTGTLDRMINGGWNTGDGTEYGLAHFKRGQQGTADRYRVQASWGLSPDPISRFSLSGGDAWSRQVAYDDLYLGAVGWGDTGFGSIFDFSLWIRES